MPSPNHFKFYGFSPKLLSDKFKFRILFKLGSSFIPSFKYFMSYELAPPNSQLDRFNIKFPKLLGNHFKPYPTGLIEYCPKLFPYKSNINVHKFFGRFFKPPAK